MKITVLAGTLEKQKTTGAIIPLFEDEKAGGIAKRVDKALGGTLSRILNRGDFKPKTGALHLLYPERGVAAERLLFVGLGKRSEFTLNRLRQALGKAAPALRGAGATDITIVADGTGLEAEELGQALTEGCLLGLYRFELEISPVKKP